MTGVLIALVGVAFACIVSPITQGLLQDEARGWVPYMAQVLVRGAARRLPKSAVARYEEEWLAELAAYADRPLSMLVRAAGIRRSAGVLGAQLAGRPAQFVGARGTVKAALDRTVALWLLAILAPLLTLIAVGVKVGSPGPVLFRQRRVGLDGEIFFLWKFRTVHVESEASLPNDRRTPLGRLLRRTSLDELPQLLNVLRGDMSLVGPRPERPEFVALLEADIPDYSRRHRVRPGVTGLAQVIGFRGNRTWSERFELDKSYVDRWSLRMDLRILLSTMLVVVLPSSDDGDSDIACGLRLQERHRDQSGE